MNRFVLLLAVFASSMSVIVFPAPLHAQSEQGTIFIPQVLQDQPPLSGFPTGDLSPGGSTPTTRGSVSGDTAVFAAVSNAELDSEIRSLRQRTAAVSVASSQKDAAVTTSASQLISLSRFAASVTSGRPNEIAGVYVPEAFALRVVPQPDNNPLFVPMVPGVVTSTCSDKQCPNVGFLAHNSLAGILFFQLTPKSEVTLVYGDGSTRRYRVVSTRSFQALRPSDPFSPFIDLDLGGKQLTSTDVHHQIYGVSNQIVFQTCIAQGGNPSWGRWFVIAQPI